MSVQALLVSRDADAVSVLQRVMHDLDVESEVCAELQPAVERLAQGATSAVVVDYDVEHASELLKLMRQNYAGSCVALAMVKGLASIQAAYDMGANFVLIKPVSAAAASRSLGEATALLERMTHRGRPGADWRQLVYFAPGTWSKSFTASAPCVTAAPARSAAARSEVSATSSRVAPARLALRVCTSRQ